ncbi:helix-turn-helix transcriptional regulator [Agaribacter flavus]|uniref:Helix-turn-helix transcriptional regulator n=1 Tax=Agaribacter flavus TaxID=1902781 RepID=A0ABV7FWK4_9ALTE
MSAQLMLLVLLYFYVFARKVLSGFCFHVAFLLSFVYYLVALQLQYYTDFETGTYILLSRILVLFGIGVPSLLLLVLSQVKRDISLNFKIALYLVAVLISTVIVFIKDMANHNFLFSTDVQKAIPFVVDNSLGLFTHSLYLVGALLVPSAYILYLEHKKPKSLITTAFILGAIVVALSQIASHHIANGFWLNYVGAIFVALCWFLAVFHHLKQNQYVSPTEHTSQHLPQAPELPYVDKTVSKDTVSLAKAYIHQHYSHIKDINEIARNCNVSRSNLMKKFKEDTNQTVNHYLTAIRINASKQLLKSQSVTVTAFEVGFNNSNYFSTVFKKFTGQSPGQFQESTTLSQQKSNL